MLCFTNSKFFSLTYELQQTSQFRGNLWTASNFSAIASRLSIFPLLCGVLLLGN